MSEFADLLAQTVDGIAELSGNQLEQLERHYAMLMRWNAKLNLTAIKTFPEAVIRHYAECIFLATIISSFGETCSVVDIGSGAGFPGIPVAVVLPQWRVTLVESHKRKAVFLRESTRNLSNVTVVAERFENVSGPFDVGVSRAVACEDIQDTAATKVRVIGLLTSSADVDRITSSTLFIWQAPATIPWNTDAAVLLGERSST